MDNAAYGRLYERETMATSRCARTDIASQGSTVEEARENLVESLTLFFECADASEIASRR